MSEVELAPAAVLLTQAAVPDALAATCALSKVPVDVVPSSIGCLVVARSAGIGDPELAATVVSRVMRDSPVVLLVQRDGSISATRWEDGREVEELVPGLMLSDAPPEIEQLLLGQVAATDLPGVESSVGMSRFRAMRVIAGAARRGARRR